MNRKIREPEVTYKIMSSIKSKGTKPEVLLGKALWRNGLRYRKNYKILGKPDLVFVKKKIAIFCDGDFWHGNNWKIRGLSSLEEELSGYSHFWRDKITRNIQRDQFVSRSLQDEGWLVLRFWGSDIEKKLDSVVSLIIQQYNEIRD
jgi:DNA mismatch endonuclease (patch repair protein)